MAVVDADQAALDHDPAVIAYAPAWRATKKDLPVKTEKISTEHHRRVYAAERLSRELADRNEDLPEAGPAREAAVGEWLDEHPGIVVGAEVPR